MKKNKNDNIEPNIQKVLEIIQQGFEERQNRPNQYVVAIYNKKDNKLIGYHLSTFCQVTEDILDAKRYSGENPYKQLEVIAGNMKYIIDEDDKENDMFQNISSNIKQKYYQNMTSSDVYLDAVYLNENTPKQQFRYEIV